MPGEAFLAISDSDISDTGGGARPETYFGWEGFRGIDGVPKIFQTMCLIMPPT